MLTAATMDEIHSCTPILVGCCRYTHKPGPSCALPVDYPSPLDLMSYTAKQALEDASLPVTEVDRVVTIGTMMDSKLGLSNVPVEWQSLFPNMPQSLAEMLGLSNPKLRLASTHPGGHTPQLLVNEFAVKIAAGECNAVLISGAEALATFARIQKEKLTPAQAGWKRPSGGKLSVSPPLLGQHAVPLTSDELVHGLSAPIYIYPLFENAMRAAKGRTFGDHMVSVSQLCSRLSEVASQNHEHAVFPTHHSALAIRTVSPSNRMVSVPYTKLMCSFLAVDQSASLVMTSVGVARRIGIPRDQWIFLHGAGNLNEQWFVSQRQELHRSEAIQQMLYHSLDMAFTPSSRVEPSPTKLVSMTGQAVKSCLKHIRWFDLYSCFPCAVEAASDVLLLNPAEQAVTVTGGLPYHGGPGNNYTTHSIAAMMERLRRDPTHFGLVTGNGLFLTEHACGIYSAAVPSYGRSAHSGESPLSFLLKFRQRNNCVQDVLNKRPEVVVNSEPRGKARVETYTVVYKRNGSASKVIIVGRLLSSSERFLANMSIKEFQQRPRQFEECLIGMIGFVSRPNSSPTNLFTCHGPAVSKL